MECMQKKKSQTDMEKVTHVLNFSKVSQDTFTQLQKGMPTDGQKHHMLSFFWRKTSLILKWKFNSIHDGFCANRLW